MTGKPRLLLQIYLAIFLAALVASGVADQLPLRANGVVADQVVKTTVDSPIARYYLEEYLTDGGGQTETDLLIRQAIDRSDARPLSNELLNDLTQRFSTDFATLYFVDRVYRDGDNRRFQKAFHAHLQTARASEEPQILPSAYKRYLFAFVPGYAYRKNQTTGADFARQRQLLNQAGLDTVLIETDGVGSIEENALVVAQEITRLSRQRRPIVLISTSKGGAEAALALGRELTPRQAQHVAAWISIGGLLRGSPYADSVSRWPKTWIAGVAFWWRGLKAKVIRNLTTGERRRLFERLTFPEHIFMLQWIGSPLSGHIKKHVRRRYNVIKKIGPNDGLTLLADEIVPGGVALTGIGLDHYYLDPEIDLKTFALARVVVEKLECERPYRAGRKMVGGNPC